MASRREAESGGLRFEPSTATLRHVALAGKLPSLRLGFLSQSTSFIPSTDMLTGPRWDTFHSTPTRISRKVVCYFGKKGCDVPSPRPPTLRSKFSTF